MAPEQQVTLREPKRELRLNIPCYPQEAIWMVINRTVSIDTEEGRPVHTDAEKRQPRTHDQVERL